MTLYVYGLMRAPEAARAVDQPPRDAPPLRSVEHRGLAALVSAMEEDDIVLRRESALAHTQTLQNAFQHGPVLPVRFGTIVADEEALERELLEPRAETLLARLHVLEGLSEMQVKATYREEPLLRSILAGQPRLAEAAARIRQLPAAATHFDRISLGEAITAAVQGRREQDSRHLLDPLTDLSVAVDVREVNHERGVLNAAFLVKGEDLEEFDAVVERLSTERAADMRFKLIGPMPAHSFADRQWEDRLKATGSVSWD